MKRKTLLTTLVLLAISTQLMAQITINRLDFVAWKTKLDTNYIANETDVKAPTEGKDQVWDYTFITDSKLAFFRDYEDMENENTFDNDYARYDGLLAFQSFVFNSYEHKAIDNDGYYSIGRTNEKAGFSISTISGGSEDSLIFVKDIQLYDGRIDEIQFPATIDDEWTQTQIRHTYFEMTVEAFGMNKTPGNNKRTVTTKTEIVGSGTLQVPTVVGDPSQVMDVLLFKETETMVDSYFIDGKPAPLVLMMAFGLSQGGTTTEVNYNFYEKGTPAAIAEFRNVSGGLAGEVTMRMGSVRKAPTSVANLDAKPISAYPNPVNIGGDITIQLPSNFDGAALSIYNANGQLMQSITNLDENQSMVTVSLASYQSGLYFYEIVNAKGTDKMSGKFTIHQ